MTQPASPDELLGSGRYADVYDLGGGRVLRRYREPDHAAEREAQVMEHARAHGVPVPAVFEASGGDIVMERADGPTMLEVLGRRPWTLQRQADLLVDLHRRVHAVPALGWLPTPFGVGVALLHTDIHPANVILTANGPRLIDWQGACAGPAEADLALTWVLLASSKVPGTTLQRVVGRTGQAVFAQMFLRRATSSATLSPWLERAIGHRMADPSLLKVERHRLARLSHRSRPASADTARPA